MSLKSEKTEEKCRRNYDSKGRTMKNEMKNYEIYMRKMGKNTETKVCDEYIFVCYRRGEKQFFRVMSEEYMYVALAPIYGPQRDVVITDILQYEL